MKLFSIHNWSCLWWKQERNDVTDKFWSLNDTLVIKLTSVTLYASDLWPRWNTVIHYIVKKYESTKKSDIALALPKRFEWNYGNIPIRYTLKRNTHWKFTMVSHLLHLFLNVWPTLRLFVDTSNLFWTSNTSNFRVRNQLFYKSLVFTLVIFMALKALHKVSRIIWRPAKPPQTKKAHHIDARDIISLLRYYTRDSRATSTLVWPCAGKM